MSNLAQQSRSHRGRSSKLILHVAFLAISLVTTGHLSLADDSKEAFFETRVRPVLINQCFECHGRSDPKGGLRVDSRDALLRGGESGPAIVVGDADASLLVRALRHTDDNIQMPPKSKLDKPIVDDITNWVNAGATWPAFAATKSKRPIAAQLVSPRAPNDPAFGPSIQLWLKSDDRGWQDGQIIHLWEDSSGRGHDQAATAGSRIGGTGAPVQFIANSRISSFPAVRFHPDSGLGGNAATAPLIAGDAEFTMLIVAQIERQPSKPIGLIAGFGELASPQNPARALGAAITFSSTDTLKPIFVGGWGNDATTNGSMSTTVPQDAPVIISLTKHRGELSTTATFVINGQPINALAGNQALPDFTKRHDLGFFLGHVQSWATGFAGDVAEVVLYNRAFTEVERSGLESHFSAKYRIPLIASQNSSDSEEGDPAFRPAHWAFEPRKQVEPPSVSMPGYESEIDRFIAKKWLDQNLQPVEQADARTLVRRLYFDLIGMPPSNDELHQAVAKLTPWSEPAWANLVDELLRSPHYGERWGRHWLDIVRYADTAGDNADYPVPEAKLYRDYVIDSFNRDLPYDQFVKEQLAGDILAAEGDREHYAERVAATGFLALSRRYATAPYELWHLTLEDTIDTVGQAFMGLTFRCARCHDHKFDPVSQREYYGLYGIFESTQFPWAGGEEFQSKKFPREHFVPLVPWNEIATVVAAHRDSQKQHSDRMAKWESENPMATSLTSLNQELASLKASSAPASDITEMESKVKKLKKQVDSMRAELNAPYETVRRRGFPEIIPIAYAVAEGTPRSAFVQRSGEPHQPGAVVARGVPTFLESAPPIAVPASQSGRRQLAEWLTTANHPLTSRVMVNRIWQQHFGKGLVATPSNFGVRGAAPTHPELLDWLANRFVADGWKIKSLHKLMLTSKVWRLASVSNPDNEIKDPENALVWHHERRRLEAEAIRDAMLKASGRLDLNRPSTHPFPHISTWNYTQHTQFKDFYDSRCRSVYLMTPRLQRHPFLSLFDGPDTNTTSGARTSAIVSAQSLYLLNSPDVKAEAEAFAKRILERPASERIAAAFADAYQRPATDSERVNADDFISAYNDQADEQSAWTAFCRSLITSHEFFYVD